MVKLRICEEVIYIILIIIIFIFVKLTRSRVTSAASEGTEGIGRGQYAQSSEDDASCDGSDGEIVDENSSVERSSEGQTCWTGVVQKEGTFGEGVGYG